MIWNGMARPRRMYAPDGGEGGAGGGSNGGGDPKPEKSGQEIDIKALVASEVAKIGSKDAALEQLVRRNYALREKNRTLEKNGVPTGAVVLTGDDVAAWNTLKALGKPDDIRAKLTEADDLKLEKGLRKHAQAIGADEDVFIDLAKTKLLAIVDREVEEESEDERDSAGKPKKVKRLRPHVMSGTGEGKRYEPLADVLQRDFPKYLPALYPTGRDSDESGTAPAAVNDRGIGFVNQRASGGNRIGGTRAAAKSSVVTSTLKNKYALPETAAKK